MADLFSLSPVARAEQVARKLRLDLNVFADSVVKQYKACYDAIWQDEDPAAVVAAMGTDAVKMFSLSIAIGQVLEAAGITEITTSVPAGYSWQANPDGSVTITKV